MPDSEGKWEWLHTKMPMSLVPRSSSHSSLIMLKFKVQQISRSRPPIDHLVTMCHIHLVLASVTHRMIWWRVLSGPADDLVSMCIVEVQLGHACLSSRYDLVAWPWWGQRIIWWYYATSSSSWTCLLLCTICILLVIVYRLVRNIWRIFDSYR